MTKNKHFDLDFSFQVEALINRNLAASFLGLEVVNISTVSTSVIRYSTVSLSGSRGSIRWHNSMSHEAPGDTDYKIFFVIFPLILMWPHVGCLCLRLLGPPLSCRRSGWKGQFFASWPPRWCFLLCWVDLLCYGSLHALFLLLCVPR